MAAPISACLIVKNEAGQIESCLKSIRPYVSEICVVDTGSTDGTPEIVKRFADKFEVYTGCNDENGLIASFADARQRSFELATQPWLFWIDGDDEVRGAEHLEELVERHDKERDGNPALVLMPYEYSHDERGNVTCLHYRERLLTPADAFKWVGPVHEVLSPQAQNVQMFQTEQVKMVHRRAQSGKAIENGRNLRILKAHYENVGESDVRQLYYLGLEYGNVGDQAMAVKFHKRYVELSGWDDEKFHACLKIAEHYQSIGHYEDAVEWATKAVIVREGWAEAYFSLSKSFYFMAQRGGREERRNWERSVHFANLGLSLPPTKTILFVNPIEREYGIHKFLNFALNKVGDVKGAMESVNRALAIRPDDDGLLGNKRIYEEHLAKEQVREGARKLKELGVLADDAVSLIDDVVEKKTGVVVPKPEAPDSGIRPASDGLDIVFYVGPGVEPWNPDTMKASGIGGSETMAAEMARLLAARGHRVRLFGDCPGLEGTFDDVRYLDAPKFQDVSCDMFISSRRPHVFDDDFGLKARATMCWVHDVSLGGALTHARALRVDRILALSQWHKDNILNCHKFVRPDQVIVTRNGIDVSRFDHDVPRNPQKAVYSSSPDRGLDVAVRAWPKVRERVPDAELHVFYGFHTWEVTVQSTGDEGQKKLIQHLKNQLKEYEKHGVVFHGRIGQEELAKEFLSAGVWAYPTWFSETSCITAMEAQAAGLHIVTSPIAALNETVGGRGDMIPGDWLSPDYMVRWVDAVVGHMTPRAVEADAIDRKALRDYARDNFGWESLADEWDAMIKKTIEEVERDVLPPYKAAI